MTTPKTALLFVLALLPACGEPPPGASAHAILPRYLFDLSDEELTAAHRRYAPETSLALLRRRLAPPFDCARFGQLCEVVGAARGAQVAEAHWARARAGRLSYAELDLALERDVINHEEQYFTERFPLGAPADSVYFGLAGGNAPVCGPPSYATSGDRRVRVNTTRINLGVGSQGRITTTHYTRNNRGRWDKSRAARIEAEGDVFVLPEGGIVQSSFVEKVETDSKTTTAKFTYAGIGSVPFVEGCGGTQEGSALWTCACSGNFPGGGDGGGGDGGGGDIPGDF